MADLEGNLSAVQARIDAAARSAGRDPTSVALLAVSKTRPADDIARLAGLGQTDFGENRVQELVAKARDVAALTDAPVGWHFVGQLQRNKAAAVARLGAVVHSVDRASLVRTLDRLGQEAARRVEVFVQVDLGGSGGEIAARGGAPIDEVPALADLVAEAPGLVLRGLMAVAPRERAAGRAFADLAELGVRIRTDHPDAVELSAGMSGDLEAAIAAGSTLVRVGTAIFGNRPLLSSEDRTSAITRVTPATGVPGAPR